MTETMFPSEASAVVTTPDSRVLPKRNGARSLLPSTWLGRTLRVEWRDASGEARTTTGKYLDDRSYFGLVLGSSEGMLALNLDRVVAIELVPD